MTYSAKLPSARIEVVEPQRPGVKSRIPERETAKETLAKCNSEKDRESA